MTQTEKVLDHIKEFGSITPLDALKEYGIMRLASRVSDLKRAGFPIVREMETSKNRNGEPVRYARYRMEETYEYTRAEN